jgi:hypothetical protein
MEDLIPEEDEARLLRVTARTLRNWRARGYGPDYVEMGRKKFYTPAANQRFVQAQERSPTPPEPRRRR